MILVLKFFFILFPRHTYLSFLGHVTCNQTIIMFFGLACEMFYILCCSIWYLWYLWWHPSLQLFCFYRMIVCLSLIWILECVLCSPFLIVSSLSQLLERAHIKDDCQRGESPKYEDLRHRAPDSQLQACGDGGRELAEPGTKSVWHPR